MNNNNITIVKKYANRRMYDTGKSCYVTLSDLADMIRDDIDFKIIDTKTKKDLTHSVLMQIIVEQESNEDTKKLLPKSFLKKIIKFHDGGMETFIPTYLKQAMQNFSASHEDIQEAMKKSFSTIIPHDSIPSKEQIDEIAKRNINLIQEAMKKLNPFDGDNKEDKDKNDGNL